MKKALVTLLAAVVLGVPAAAHGGTSGMDANGTFLVDGSKAFPIVLTLGPPLGSTTPTGADALNEVTLAGVNFFRAGASGAAFTDAVLAEAEAWNQAAAARGAHTWINLRELARAQPGTATETRLRHVVTTLGDDPGLGLWKGADEPWLAGWSPSLLQFPYCLTTSRGDPAWCDQTAALDPRHLWVTIQGPRGTAADLAPYSPVTDVHGVNIYPVTLAATDPDLHQVGAWTQTMRSITPNQAVWTTVQVCASGSFDQTGRYLLPTLKQERYMVYDAIINGARAINFFGGRNENCFSPTDAAYGWNWTFWNDVLKELVLEIGPRSALYPALLNPGSAVPIVTNDSTMQATTRRVGSDLWVIAARHGTGRSSKVTLSGIPAAKGNATVYGEGRSLPVRNGAITDTFGRWDVHVYKFRAR